MRRETSGNKIGKEEKVQKGDKNKNEKRGNRNKKNRFTEKGHSKQSLRECFPRLNSVAVEFTMRRKAEESEGR